MKEIEILYELHEPLVAAKTKLSDVKWLVTQVKDTYFESRDHSRLSPGSSGRLTSSFRLREQGEVAKLTYKNDVFSETGTWLYSDESEIAVSDPRITRAMIDALGYRELVTIDTTKHRCDVEDYEIVLEEVRGLGNFIEIEYKGQQEKAESDVAAVKDLMRAFLEKKDIRIGEELNAGKPELMLKRKQILSSSSS